MSGRIAKSVVSALDATARAAGIKDPAAPHIATGRRGEEAAYFHLRKLGYTMVARNWRSPRRAGELDLVGWDDGVLCFIEVKTRPARDAGEPESAFEPKRIRLGDVPAEAAVDAAKRDELLGVAREFLRRQPERTPARVDVVSVYLGPGGEPADITVFKNCFAVL